MLTGPADQSYRRLLARHGEIVDRFEDAWLAGSPQRIEELIEPVDSADRLPLLVELVHIDLERRLTSGEMARVESYFSRFPELSASAEVAIDLISVEFSLRRKVEPSLSPLEFVQRFPELSGNLHSRLAVLSADPSTIPRRDGQVEPGASISPSEDTATRPAGDTWRRAALSQRHSEGARFPRMFGDYELTGEIARGGMGVVYRARQMGLNRQVALKMILSGELAGAEAVRRFRAEAEAAAQLRHPGIVAVYDVGEVEGQHFFSMEYVEGQSLSALAREKAFSPEGAAQVMRPIAEAIQYAHERGVLHRDLKPSNVLIDIDGRPRVTDFGLAKRMNAGNAGLTQTHDVMGTPSYMPPEQAAGRIRELGPRCDVYSLGAMLYELLTGRPPFRAATPLETLKQVLEQEPVSPRLLNPKTPRDLETICLKCLEKDAARRYAAAQDLADELGRFLRNEPLVARPLGRFSRGVRWCRRKPLAAAVVGLLLLLVVSLAVGMPLVTLALLDAKKQKGIAQSKEQVAKEEKASADIASRRSEVRRLAAESRSVRDRFPVQGTLLALEAIHLTPRSEHEVLAAAESELRDCLSEFGGWPLPGVGRAAFSSDGRWLATVGVDGKARLCSLAATDLAASARELRGGTAKVVCLAFSPEGRWLATGGDSTVRLWDLSVPDPAVQSRELRGREGGVQALAFSGDGRWLASSGGETAHLWNLADSENVPAPRVVEGHEGAVTCLAISPNGRWLATGEFWNVVRLVDLAIPDTATSPRELVGHSGMVNCLAMSPDNRWLATASVDKTVCLWDLSADDPAAEPRVLRGHEGLIRCAAISPDGRWLATGGVDKSARLWDLAALDAPPRVLGDHEGGIQQLAISPDGRWLVAAGDDKVVRVCDLTISDEPASRDISRGPKMAFGDLGAIAPRPGLRNVAKFRELRGHEAPVEHLAVSPDSHWLVTSGKDQVARVWDLSAGGTTPRVLRGHQNSVVYATFAGGRLFTGGTDNAVRVWDASANGSRVLRGPGAPITCTTASPDGRRLVMGLENSTVLLWNVASTEGGDNARILKGHEAPVSCAAFSANGQTLVTGSFDHSARVWDLSSSNPAAGSRALRSHADSIMGLAISRDGHRLVTVSRDGKLRLWDLTVADPEQSSRQPPGLDGQISSFDLSDDGRWLVAGRPDNSALLWDLSLSEAQTPFVLSGHKHLISRFAFSADGRRLASAGLDGVARVWDLLATDPAAESLLLRGHEGPLNCLAFLLDGNRLATGSEDRTVRLWNLEASKPESSAVVLRGHDERVTCLSVSPDGSKLLTGSHDGTARLWDVPLDRLLTLGQAIAGRSLSAGERRKYRLAVPDETDESAYIGPARETEIRNVLPGWPKDPRFHEQLAESSLAAGALFAARFHVDQVIKLEPEIGRHRGFRARLFLESEHWSEAAADLERAVRSDQGNPPLWHTRALAHLAADELDKYAESCQLMLERSSDPDWHFFLLDAARVSPRCGVKSGRLVEIATAFASINRGVGERFLAAALYRDGKYDQASKKLEEAGQFGPHFAWDHFFLAMTYYRLDKPEEARRALEAGNQWMERSAQFLDREWRARVISGALRREATELLAAPANQ